MGVDRTVEVALWDPDLLDPAQLAYASFDAEDGGEFASRRPGWPPHPQLGGEF